MESNNKSDQVGDTEMDCMLNKNDIEVSVKSSANSPFKKYYLKTQHGLWLSLKMFFILIIIFFILLIIISIVIFMASNSRNINKNNKTLDDNQTQWNNCLQLSSKLKKCFDKPLCQKEKLPLSQLNVTQNVKDVRLPISVIPNFYAIVLQPHIHLSDPNQFFFNGSTEILAVVTNVTSVIKIHSFRLIVNESLIKVLDSNNQELAIKNITYDIDRQWFKIEMENPLQPETNIKMIFGQFIGSLKPSHELKGWYLSSYKEKNVIKYLATSQLQPTDARMVFPCFDEPAFKAKFKVSIIRKTEYHALANMERINSIELQEGWVLDEFKQTFTMSTYLLAFVVSQFDYIRNVDKRGRNFTVWSRPDVIRTANYSLTIGIQILEFFEEYFELEYPLNKTDMVAVPDFAAGAMENWGLMIYREITMLWDSKLGSSDSRQKVATVVSHEIAHQWFGNLVTLKWWDDLWLNEGFASFVEYVGVSHIHKDWLMDEQFALHELQKVLISDSMVTSHPVLMPVYHPNEINEIFDTISYNKGASVLRMMEAFLGQETFRKGLKKYLNTYKYKNTIHDDLWKSLSDQASLDGKTIPVKEIMNTWIMQMGYPLVTLNRIGDDKLLASQEHFVINSETEIIEISSPFNFTWSIPLTYASKSAPFWNQSEDVIWFKNKSQEVTLPNLKKNDWVIFNLHQAGFYRTNYDIKNWENLIKQLKDDHTVIPVKNRAQLIDDLFNLGKVAIVNFSLVLNLTEYLKNETDYIPWEAANRMFAFLDSMLDTDEYYGLLQEYLSYLIDPIYRTVDWKNRIESNNHIQNLMRPIAVNIACNAKHSGCVNQAIEKFNEFVKTNNNSNIPTSLRYIVYCIGIKNSGIKEWDFLYSKLDYHSHEDEIARIIKALSCSREPWILKRFIKMLLNKETMKVTQIVDMMGGLGNNPTGKYVFSDFLWTHYRNISKSGNLLLFARVYAKKCHKPAECMSVEELIKIRTFAMESGLMVNDKVFAQAIEQVKQNQIFMRLHRDTIGEWLKNSMLTKKIVS